MERPTRMRPLFVYDGDCGFCTSSVRFIERHIPLRAEVTPFQNADLDALGTTRARATREVLWIDRDEPRGRAEPPGARVYGGAAAVAHLLVAAGGPWALLGRLIMYPPMSWAAAAVYRLVSANRYRLPGGTPACAIGAAAPGATPPEAAHPNEVAPKEAPQEAAPPRAAPPKEAPPDTDRGGRRDP
jgi:predicted DCC family thiol-disulfide oxidoreductase YuxK